MRQRLSYRAVGNRYSLYDFATLEAGLPVVFNNMYRDRVTPGTGGRPSGGEKSQHLAGFAFDINSSLLNSAQRSTFTSIARAWGFVEVQGDPGHYVSTGGAELVHGTFKAGVDEASRSYKAGECTDANVQAESR